MGSASDIALVTDAGLPERAQVVIALGGDGTMLGALRLVARRLPDDLRELAARGDLPGARPPRVLEP
jgi:hypothetical protein